jgi:hypothetical protein
MHSSIKTVLLSLILISEDSPAAMAQKAYKCLLFQPVFFRIPIKKLFSSATRTYDIYFKYPWSELDAVQIELPKDLTAEVIDPKKAISGPRKIGRLSIEQDINKTGGMLSYKRNFYFDRGKKILFPASSYTALKQFLDSFHSADTNLVTLVQR